MRLTAISIQNVPPIAHFRVDGLSDVVVIAGPNGVGKTRVIQSLIQHLRNPAASSQTHVIVQATSQIESKAWGKAELNTADAGDANMLRSTLQRQQRRNKYVSSVLNFESDRAVRNINPFAFSFDIADPYQEDVGWDLSYGFLRDRFQDVQHTIFRLVTSQERDISRTALRLMSEGVKEMQLDFPDPLKEFKDAFDRLLGPKKLVRADLRSQTLIYETVGQELSINELSSGEREVINIVFDFIIRNPSESIVIFDEPELHLHPELSYKLLQSLSAVGKNNQFIFCTHSPEIITASIENSVIFLAPRKDDTTNQALVVHRDDTTHRALHLLGQSIGIISLGKKLVLIEGDESSLDKQTYGAILKAQFPEFVLVPVGGKHTITSFEQVRQGVLNQTIWGVEFYLLCDRDGVYQLGIDSVSHNASPRLKVLPRYHIENFFLDERVLAACFTEMEAAESWLRDPEMIKAALTEAARETVPYAVSLKISALTRERAGNVDMMPKGVDRAADASALVQLLVKQAQTEVARVQASLDFAQVEKEADAEYKLLMAAINGDTPSWRADVPGRIVLSKFAGRARIDIGRLKRLYIKEAERADPNPFAEVTAIFDGFRHQ